MTLEITPSHRELAAQLVQASRAGDDVAFFDTLGAVTRDGLSSAVAVVAVLARQLAAALPLLHGPDGARAAITQAILDARRPGDE